MLDFLSEEVVSGARGSRETCGDIGSDPTMRSVWQKVGNRACAAEQAFLTATVTDLS